MPPRTRSRSRGAASRDDTGLQAFWSVIDFKERGIYWTWFWRLLLFRIINAACQQTYFVPDEYWQGPEVAHRMAYGFGHLTWEWQHSIRTYSHPLLYAVPFRFLALLGLDHRLLVSFVPGLISAVFAAGGDIATLHLARRLFGPDVASLALLCQVGSACYFYCMSRPLINAVETTLTTAAFSLWPWTTPASSRYIRFPERRSALCFAAAACALRPTAALLFAPLAIAHLFALRDHRAAAAFVAEGCGIGGAALLAAAAVDRAGYGEWVVVQLRFLAFNLSGRASLYGTHPWYWYFAEGFASLFTTWLPFVLMGVAAAPARLPLLPAAVSLFVHSFLPHKEFRFLLPLLPLGLCYAAFSLSSFLAPAPLRPASSSRPRSPSPSPSPALPSPSLTSPPPVSRARRRSASSPSPSRPPHLPSDRLPHRFRRWLFALSLAVNAVAALYLSLLHQRGPVAAMRELSRQAAAAPEESAMRILFLTPCHATPYYSAVHRNISMQFLDCSPHGMRPRWPHYTLDAQCHTREIPGGELVWNVDGPYQHGDKDETSRFYEDPMSFLLCAYGDGAAFLAEKEPPTHVVTFDLMTPRIAPFLREWEYQLTADLFHAHLVLDDRTSARLLIFERQSSKHSA